MVQDSTSLLSSWRSLFGLCLMVALWYPSTLAQSAEEMMESKKVTALWRKAQLMARHLPAWFGTMIPRGSLIRPK